MKILLALCFKMKPCKVFSNLTSDLFFSDSHATLINNPQQLKFLQEFQMTVSKKFLSFPFGCHIISMQQSLCSREGSQSATRIGMHINMVCSLPSANRFYFVLLSLKACVYIILSKRGQSLSSLFIHMEVEENII